MGRRGKEDGKRLPYKETRVRLGVFTSTSPTRTIDYENKNRCTHPRIIRINDDDVFRSALAKIEEGKLVIWINGDKGYNGPLKSVRNSRQIPELKSPLSIRINWKRNSLRLRQLAMALTLSSGRTTALVAMLNLACWLKSPRQSVPGQAVSVYRDAVRYNGKLIAYPIAVEALSLIYNKDLLPNPPKHGKRSRRWIKN